MRSLTRLIESDADLLSAQLKELRIRAFPPAAEKKLRKFTSGEAAKLKKAAVLFGRRPMDFR